MVQVVGADQNYGCTNPNYFDMKNVK
jgi:hypothetical protein